MACKEPEFNFGDRPNTGVVEHVFTIQNQGDAPLRIGNIRACCGATAGIESSVIAPGSNSNLKATINLAGRRGEMKKSFYIASNDPNQPYYQIRMIGNPTAEVYVDPGDLDFGHVRPTGNPPGIVHLAATLADDIEVVPRELVLVSAPGKVEPVTRYLALRSRRDSPFNVLKVETPDPAVKVKIDKLSPAGYRLEFENFRAFAALDGKSIMIRTDHPDGTALVIPIRVIREPEGAK
ncbi:MAG: DUF1573 domain-containing protein [Lentisphaerota bacterium]